MGAGCCSAAATAPAEAPKADTSPEKSPSKPTPTQPADEVKSTPAKEPPKTEPPKDAPPPAKEESKTDGSGKTDEVVKTEEVAEPKAAPVTTETSADQKATDEASAAANAVEAPNAQQEAEVTQEVADTSADQKATDEVSAAANAVEAPNAQQEAEVKTEDALGNMKSSIHANVAARAQAAQAEPLPETPSATVDASAEMKATILANVAARAAEPTEAAPAAVPETQEPAVEATTGDVQATSKPKLFLIGPPSSGKGTLTSKLVSGHKLAHIREIWLKKAALAKEEKTEAGKEAEALGDGEMSTDLMIRLLKESIADSDGCVVDGMPKDVAQAQAIASVDGGIGADKLVVVDVSKEDIVAFHAGRLYDEQEMKFYHKVNNPPPEDAVERCQQRPDDTEEEVLKRIEPYFAALPDIMKAFPEEGIVKIQGTTQGNGSEEEKAMVAKACEALGLPST